MPFDYSFGFPPVDFRKQSGLYRAGRGEQVLLLVRPCKGEILPFWRFKDAAAATGSSTTIRALFEAYLAANDFVGADMARQFLRMALTRARRYANHRGGQKYAGPVPDDKKGPPGAPGRAAPPTPTLIKWRPPKFSAANGTRPTLTPNTCARKKPLSPRMESDFTG